VSANKYRHLLDPLFLSSLISLEHLSQSAGYKSWVISSNKAAIESPTAAYKDKSLFTKRYSKRTQNNSMTTFQATGKVLADKAQRKESESLDLLVQPSNVESRMESLLTKTATKLCEEEGINFAGLLPIQRLFLTHYRCSSCRLVPLYLLNIRYPNKPRCSKCGQLVSFTSTGKYGRIRKKIVFSMALIGEPGGNRIGG